MDTNSILSKIDSLKIKIGEAPALNEGELTRLREHFMVEYTYNSNAIEGNTLSLHETSLVVLEGLTIDKKPLRDHLEAIGHKDAFYYVLAKANDGEDLTERTIREIHSLVLMDDADNRGKYRSVPVQISGALDTPPSPIHISEQMESLLKSYANDKRHPIEKIADFHILFERIHPFIDGNGRTGRLIMNLELIKAGFAPIDVKFQDRDLYIDCFKDYERTGSSDKFIDMVAKYELAELEKMHRVVTVKQEVQSSAVPLCNGLSVNVKASLELISSTHALASITIDGKLNISDIAVYENDKRTLDIAFPKVEDAYKNRCAVVEYATCEDGSLTQESVALANVIDKVLFSAYKNRKSDIEQGVDIEQNIPIQMPLEYNVKSTVIPLRDNDNAKGLASVSIGNMLKVNYVVLDKNDKVSMPAHNLSPLVGVLDDELSREINKSVSRTYADQTSWDKSSLGEKSSPQKSWSERPDESR